MNKYKDQMDLIRQSIEDVKYMKNSSRYPTLGIINVLTFWIIPFSILTMIIYAIYILNIRYKLYNYTHFYTVYNVFKIMAYLLLPIITYVYICKSRMSLQERRFMKSWIVFPILISLNQIGPIVISFLVEDYSSYYSYVSISLFIVLISFVYIYSYCQYKSILIIILLNILCILFSFIYIVIYPGIKEMTIIHILIYNIVITFKDHNIMEILLTYLLIYFMERRIKGNDENNASI